MPRRQSLREGALVDHWQSAATAGVSDTTFCQALQALSTRGGCWCLNGPTAGGAGVALQRWPWERAATGRGAARPRGLLRCETRLAARLPRSQSGVVSAACRGADDWAMLLAKTAENPLEKSTTAPGDQRAVGKKPAEGRTGRGRGRICGSRLQPIAKSRHGRGCPEGRAADGLGLRGADSTQLFRRSFNMGG